MKHSSCFTRNIQCSTEFYFSYCTTVSLHVCGPSSPIKKLQSHNLHRHPLPKEMITKYYKTQIKIKINQFIGLQPDLDASLLLRFEQKDTVIIVRVLHLCG